MSHEWTLLTTWSYLQEGVVHNESILHQVFGCIYNTDGVHPDNRAVHNNIWHCMPSECNSTPEVSRHGYLIGTIDCQSDMDCPIAQIATPGCWLCMECLIHHQLFQCAESHIPQHHTLLFQHTEDFTILADTFKCALDALLLQEGKTVLLFSKALISVAIPTSTVIYSPVYLVQRGSPYMYLNASSVWSLTISFCNRSSVRPLHILPYTSCACYYTCGAITLP